MASECMSGLNGLMGLLVKTKFGALSGSLASWAETHSQKSNKIASLFIVITVSDVK